MTKELGDSEFFSGADARVGIVLAVLYLSLFAFACAVMYGFVKRGRTKKLPRRIAWIFFVSVSLQVIVRGTSFLLNPFIYNEGLCVPESISIVLTTFSGFFMFTSYVLALLFWAELYVHAHHTPFEVSPLLEVSSSRKLASSVPMRRLRNFMLLVVIFLLLLIFFMYLWVFRALGFQFCATVTPSIAGWTTYEEVIYVVTAIIFFCSVPGTVSFVYFLFSTYMESYNLRLWAHAKTNRALRSIGIKALICLLSMLTRGVVVIVQVVVDLDERWYYTLVYYMALEILPVLLMILILQDGADLRLASVPTTARATAVADNDSINRIE